MIGRHDAVPLSPAWPDRAAWGTARSLRAWQTAAMHDYVRRSPRDYLAVAPRVVHDAQVTAQIGHVGQTI